MDRTSTASTKIARWFLAALIAVNLYRAITQSVTPGEAWNYNRFVAPPWVEAFSRFDINNHVLNTLLVRISTSRFHLTELSLRLPSLLAGILYLWVVYRMARRWFGGSFVFLAMIALLTLNPPVIDAMSEARGYGMALACWMWALELMLESLVSFSAQKLNLSGMCLGLSVAASLAFVAPACALLIVHLLWSKSRTPVLAAFLTAFVLLVIPLNHAEWNTLAVGATSLRQTINEFIALSLGTSLKIFGTAARVALALLALAGSTAAVRHWRRQDGMIVGITGATLALTLVFLIIGHSFLLTPFPQEGAIYLIPLTVLPVTAGILKGKNKAAQIAFLGLSGLLLVRYVTEFPVGPYSAGSQFGGGRMLAKTLREKVGPAAARIGASPDAEPIMNYYRTRYRQGNWRLTERQLNIASYDYYVLTPGDAALIDQRHLRVLYRNAGLSLAQ
jgi:uncharacterized membrane protein